MLMLKLELCGDIRLSVVTDREDVSEMFRHGVSVWSSSKERKTMSIQLQFS